MKIARSLPPRPREDSSVLARARDARGSGALSAPHRAPLHSLRAEQSRGYGEEEEPQVERRTTTSNTQLCYQNRPGSREVGPR